MPFTDRPAAMVFQGPPFPDYYRGRSRGRHLQPYRDPRDRWGSQEARDRLHLLPPNAHDQPRPVAFDRSGGARDRDSHHYHWDSQQQVSRPEHNPRDSSWPHGRTRDPPPYKALQPEAGGHRQSSQISIEAQRDARQRSLARDSHKYKPQVSTVVEDSRCCLGPSLAVCTMNGLITLTETKLWLLLPTIFKRRYLSSMLYLTQGCYCSCCSREHSRCS